MLELFEKNIQVGKLPDLNKINGKRGYPIHIAIQTGKFKIVLRMLNLAKTQKVIDPCIKSQIDANLIHLLFVKFDKDLKLANEILKQSIELGVDVNHVDTLNATPIHVAMRKRQIQAVEAAIRINKESKKPVFNFNVINARGTTPVHYAIEKHDHEMLMVILKDPYVDL